MNGTLLHTEDADTRYDEDSDTRNRETRPPCWPADHHNKEQTEQQNQPQCNHRQCETQAIPVTLTVVL